MSPAQQSHVKQLLLISTNIFLVKIQLQLISHTTCETSEAHEENQKLEVSETERLRVESLVAKETVIDKPDYMTSPPIPLPPIPLPPHQLYVPHVSVYSCAINLVVKVTMANPRDNHKLISLLWSPMANHKWLHCSPNTVLLETPPHLCTVLYCSLYLQLGMLPSSQVLSATSPTL